MEQLTRVFRTENVAVSVMDFDPSKDEQVVTFIEEKDESIVERIIVYQMMISFFEKFGYQNIEVIEKDKVFLKK